MDWDRLKIFHAVAEKGSLLGAATFLKMSQSAVSRHIGYLEDYFKIPLLYRQSRGITLSQAGEILYEACQEIFVQFIVTQTLLMDIKGSHKKNLRIYAPSDFGVISLSTCLAGFMKIHPNFCLEIVLDYTHRQQMDFRDIDVAIHTKPVFYAGFISVPILQQSLKLYAARDYLKKFGVPFKPHHLDHHRLICFDNSGQESASSPYRDYLLSLGANPKKPRTPFLSLSSTLTMAQCVEKGLGISLLSPYIAATLRGVVEILPDLPTPVVEAFLTYPEQLQKTSGIKALQKFILEEFQSAPYSMETKEKQI